MGRDERGQESTGENGMEWGRIAWNGMGWDRVGGRERMEKRGEDTGWDGNWRSGKGQGGSIPGQLVDDGMDSWGWMGEE